MTTPSLEEMVAMDLPVPIRLERLDWNETEDYWAKFEPWVRKLAQTYLIQPNVIPPCWFNHPGLVEELSALHTAYLSSYDASSPANAPIHWHRELEYCVNRLREFVQKIGCTAQQHNQERQLLWVSDETYAENFVEYVQDVLDAVEQRTVEEAMQDLDEDS